MNQGSEVGVHGGDLRRTLRNPPHTECCIVYIAMWSAHGAMEVSRSTQPAEHHTASKPASWLSALCIMDNRAVLCADDTPRIGILQ